MGNLTFKDVRTLPILRSLCKNPLLLYVYFMFMIMFTLCFTKAEGQVRTIPQNAGLNSAVPSSCGPYFGNTPPCALYLTQSVQLYPAWQPSSSKKRKSIRIEGPGNNCQIICSFQSWHEIPPTHPISSLRIAANTTPFAATCWVFLLPTNDPQTVPHPTVQHRIAVASGRPN